MKTRFDISLIFLSLGSGFVLITLFVTHRSSAWSGFWLSLALLSACVTGFLFLQLPNLSFVEKHKRRLQKLHLIIGAFVLVSLPFEAINARDKQARRDPYTIKIARLQAENKRLEAQNAEFDARKNSR